MMKASLLLFVAAAAAVLSGCCSYCELSTDRFMPRTVVDGGERPIASYEVMNVSYSFFGCIPFCTGTVWTEGPYRYGSSNGISYFKDNCTIDENLKSVKAALREVGSNRVCNLVTEVQEDRGWSLFLIKRKLVKTTCLILEPNDGEAAAE